ncbi:MAG: hypothetical protein WCK70_17545, partial [Chloroflexales bacterium]
MTAPRDFLVCWPCYHDLIRAVVRNAEDFPFDALNLKPETSHLKPYLADALNLKPETSHLKPCLADALNLKPETSHLKPCL